MTTWLIIFVASMTIAVVGFAVFATSWLKKLRHVVTLAIGETASRQIATTQRLENKIARMEKQQEMYEQRLGDLIGANARLRRELGKLEGRVDTAQHDQEERAHSKLLH